MRTSSISMPLLTIAVGLGLSACGGGGSAGVASTPPPPVTPTPTPAGLQILNTGGVSQEFTSKGATYPASLGQIGSGTAVPAPLLDDSDQLKLRYDASSNTYEIQLPQAQNWLAIAPVAGSPGEWVGSGVTLTTGGGDSNAIVKWNTSNSFGVVAVGIPTNPANVAFSTASYTGFLTGYSSEIVGSSPGLVGGNISLRFVMGSSSLTGTIFPTLTLGQTYTLPTLDFTDTIHAIGTTSFSGKFDTNLPGVNSFSGSLTGVTGSRVMGNFAFPYSSPVTGTSQQAAGAFSGFLRSSCC